MLKGKTALVTGSARGIGLAIAQHLGTLGVRVLVTGRNEGEVDAVAASLHGISLPTDLSTREGVQHLIDRVFADVGHLDILINNAGIAESAPYYRTDDDSWDRTFAVNVTAPFMLCRAFIPLMVSSGWGRVINVASNAGRVGYPYTSAYCASKHALIGLTRALASELAKTQVTVNAVCPGWVRTDMAAEAVARIADKTQRSMSDAEAALSSMSPQNRLIEPSEVAHLVASLLAHEARGIHGQAIPLDGGQVMA